MASETPWARGKLSITRAALDLVEEDAKKRYQTDEEACGYVTGPANPAELCDTVVSLENLANKLHRLDPQTYFRTARTFFAFNEKKFDDAVRSGVVMGRPVKILYHSHLDAGAYFSATDAAVLSFGEAPAFEGAPARLGPGPQWPLAFLVTSVRGPSASPTVDDHKFFVWDGSAFVEAKPEVIA